MNARRILFVVLLILIFLFLVPAFLNSFPLNNTISTRIADIDWNKSQSSDSNYFQFSLIIELWNPNPYPITVSFTNVIPLFDVTLNSKANFTINQIKTVVPEIVKRTYNSGLTNTTVKFNVMIDNYTNSQLPDGKYSFVLEKSFYDPNHRFIFKYFNATLNRSQSIDSIIFDKIPDNWGSY